MNCPWCGAGFEPQEADQAYCCRAHKMQAHKKRRLARRRADKAAAQDAEYRARVCGSKVNYRSEAHAAQAALLLPLKASLEGRDAPPELCPYLCRHCMYWHLTSHERKETRA